ncbi:MAG: PAS domain S-box protein, partial [Euryarchaeota archaeon]|nr:PAS domain S-box protein [Euryarchaeota archaeon]
QGLDTFRAVYEHAAHLPILVLTVSDDEALGEQLLQEGAQRFLSKDALALGAPYAQTFKRTIRNAIAHKQAERAFRQLSDENARQVRMFDAMLSSLPDPIYLLDPHERFIYVCIQCEQMFGVPREALIGKTWQEAGISSTLMKQLHRHFTKVVKTATPVTMDIDIDTPRGHKQYECSLSPIFTPDKEVEGIVLSTHDVTERVRAEAALKTSEEQLKTLFESSPIIQIRYDPEGVPIVVNRAAREFFGIDDVSAIRHLSIFTSPRVSDENKAQLRAGKPTRYEQMYDFDAIKREGGFPTTRSGVRHVDFSLAPIFDAEGRLEAYLAQIVDITERKRAEGALQQAHEEVQALNEELQLTNEELFTANETLEQRVQERTAELASTNEELRVSNEGLRHETEERTRAEKAARTQTRHTALLNTIIRRGNITSDVQDFLQYVCDVLTSDLGYDAVDMRIITDDDSVAEQIAVTGFPAEFNKQFRFMSIDDPILRAVYRGEPYFPARFAKTHVDLVHATNMASIGIVPLVVGETIIGDMGVALKDYRPFSPDEQALLISIGHEAGTVLARLQAEEQVRAGSRYVRSLIEASLDPLVTISAKGLITDVNKATEEATGYSRDELIGSDFSDYFTEPEQAQAGYKKVFTDGFVKDYPLTLCHKSGSVIDVLYNATVYRNEAGEVQGVFAAARDITDRKRAEEELHRYSSHLEDLVEERTTQLKDSERLAAIGQTAAMIGHDLRNPLQGLQYIVDLQKLRFERMSSRTRGTEYWQKEEVLFDRISDQIFYMDKIVGDLQDYARPIAPEHEEITIRTVIDDVLESLPSVDGVKTVINVSDLTFVADPHLMLRVFSNLILNAIQAMPEGGTLTIGAESTEGSVAIRVTDTGVGIPADMRDKVFSPLTTGKAKGTGLGLAVVKRIVEAHNGTITFESEEGKGTTFTVKLPETADD